MLLFHSQNQGLFLRYAFLKMDILILHIVMTGSVGGRTDRRTVEVDIDKREMLSCFLIEDMAYDISVGRIQGGMIVSLCPR